MSRHFFVSITQIRNNTYFHLNKKASEQSYGINNPYLPLTYHIPTSI